jgi:perosamine synthetase
LIPVNRPLISGDDRLAVIDSLTAGEISGQSEPVSNLEKSLGKFLDVKYVSVVSSGTSALDLAIESLKLDPGDECVVPTFTIISTISNLIRKKVKIIFVDADSHTFNMDANKAVEAITSNTKLVIPVHIYGLPVDLDPILDRTSEVGAFVLEDSAEALGLKYKGKYCGSIGNASIFSFYANKIVTGGEGGAIASNDKDFIDKVNYYKNLCFEPKNRFVHNEFGWNARLNGLSASLINSQLSRIEILREMKIHMANEYLEGLKGHPWLGFMPRNLEYSQNMYWVFPILIKNGAPYNASSLQKKLFEQGVETRRFFCPLHLQPALRNYPFISLGGLETSELIWEMGLYLPSGLGNTTDEIHQVIEIIWNLAK